MGITTKFSMDLQLEIKTVHPVKAYFRVKNKNISRPGRSGPRAAPEQYAPLRLRLLHRAGRARQEEEINIHIPRAGVYGLVAPRLGRKTFFIAPAQGNEKMLFSVNSTASSESSSACPASISGKVHAHSAINYYTL